MAYTSSVEKVTIAVRRRCRDSLRSPSNVNCDSRGRLTMLAPGSSFSTIGRMVAAPSTSVSSRPRRLSMRSVKTWPRSMIGAKLDFVDRDERRVELARHGFDGRHPDSAGSAA